MPAQSEGELRTVAIHEAAHGLLSVASGIPVKLITIKGDADKGYDGHVEYDDNAVKARLVACQQDVEE
jgi:hypothetical protein